jgi:multidrug efflux system membrane fusion protein
MTARVSELEKVVRMVGRIFRVLLLLAVLVGLGAGVYHVQFQANPKAATNGRQKDGGRAQPVVVAKSVAKPTPRQFDTVGRVQTMASVAVRSRIDGVIEKVPVTEGQEVKAGDPLFIFDTRQLQASLRQAEANLAKDTAQLEQARRELARIEPLAQRDYATKSSVDQQRANVGSLEASVASDNAAIESMHVQISYATINAPIAGRIGSINFKTGSSIKANDTTPLVTINQIKPIYVTFSAPQRFLPEIQNGMSAGRLLVTVTAPDRADLSETGVVAYTDNAVDTTTNTLGVWASFPNDDMKLWPGLYVNATLVFGTQEDAITVAAEAIQAGQSSPFVFVVKPDMTAEMRPVTVDRVVNGEAVIAQGLSPDETVVVDGQLRLSDGTKVTITQRDGAGGAEKVAEDRRAGGPRSEVTR